MSMTEERTDADVIDLEPTVQLRRESPGKSQLWSAATRGPAVGMVEGSIASLTGETNNLRKSRLIASALLLASLYAVLLIWNFAFDAEDLKAIWIVMGVRFLLSAVVAGLLLSRFASTEGRVLALEIILFGGLTALIVVSQYAVNLHLMHNENLPGVVAFIKNGVIQSIVLMMLYGMFIPHRPQTVAKVVFAMALAEPFTLAWLTERTDTAAMIERFLAVEPVGSNVLILLLGAGIATYGGMIVNGLRAELHEARKFGQYQLIEKIGAGGMGEVHLAEHQLLKRPCALKLIKPESGADPMALARFEREVRSAARLAHPNTIEIYDYGHTVDGTFYYVMEYLKGLSLSELVREAGPLPPGRAVHLFRQICAGLSEAHGIGLIHRDLKPANVFVARLGGESDIAKVLDFGLVKVTQDPHATALTTDLTISGTPLYMAPEQATGDRSLDARADIYAIGAMLYFALTGRPPFEGESPFAVMMAHARDPVVPPSEVAPGIPSDLEAIVLRCLAKRADDRYPNVKALGRALAACESAHEWDADRADDWWAAHVAHETVGLEIEA